MSTTAESRLSSGLILNLRGRLKHSQNVTKILESQLDTAQQNISLLQGQVRLANETIQNLKKHFHETENIFSQFLTPDQQSKMVSFESDITESSLDMSQKANGIDGTTRSPLHSETGTDCNKSCDEKNKSPYAIQLRQVLDVLDEEPRKARRHCDDNTSSTDCTCTECQTPKHYDECDCGGSLCCVDIYHRKSEEFCKIKYKPVAHVQREELKSPNSYSRKDSHTPHTTTYKHNCSGPCCNSRGESSYQFSDKAPYMSIHSPRRSTHNKHSESHHGVGEHRHGHHGHCNEKSRPHANYVSYGYHVLENVPPGMPESLQSLSPSSRRKRSYIPMIPTEEPPHLKYTKVKRIDGSKLTAQKVLQDFTKRRLLPYNPRIDLDLLIVPPPIPAVDLIKKHSNSNHVEVLQKENVLGIHRNGSATNHSTKNPPTEQSKKTSNNDNDAINNNSNLVFNREVGSFKSLKQLSAIKEEYEENRNKLDSKIEKLCDAKSKTSRSTSMSTHHQKTTFYDISPSPPGGKNTLKQEQSLVTVGTDRNF